MTQVESEKFAKLREAEEIVMALKDQIDFAINSQRSPDFYEIDQYMENLKVMDVWLDNILAPYYPSQLTVIGSQMRFSPYSSKEVIDSFSHPEENFFYDLYEKWYLDDILKQDIDIFGISITSVEQLSLIHI